jgi:hypothetical protein
MSNSKKIDVSKLSLNELVQLIFIDWYKYYEDEFDTIKCAKKQLKEVCPHDKIIDDCADVGWDSVSFSYCQLCDKIIE